MPLWHSIQDVSCYASPRLLFESLTLWNSNQLVSHCASPMLYLNHWPAFMKFHLACELLCTSWALFESLTYCHEIPSSMWVAVCSVLGFLGSICIADMSFMKFYPDCKLCTFWALFESLTCLHPASELMWTFWALFEPLIYLHKILSRLWVAAHLYGSIQIIDMPPWNLIQNVSCFTPSRLYLNRWYVPMKFYPGCELQCISIALFEFLICLHELLSRMWVAMHLLVSIWINGMPSWNPIQDVNCSVLPWLYLNHWHALWNPIQQVGCFTSPRLYFNH